MSALNQVLDSILKAAAQNGIPTGQALAAKANVAPETLSRIRSRGTADYASISKLAEAAGLELIVQASTKPRPMERKSQKLGLDFPYDWSNSLMDDQTLIEKVLDRNRFEDVARITSHYGLQEIESVASKSPFSTRQDVTRSLSNIRKAWAIASA